MSDAEKEFKEHAANCPVCSKEMAVDRMCPEGRRLHAAQFEGDEV